MFFVDTNVLIYALSDSPYRDPCRSIVRAVASGAAAGRISAAVAEELWHLELRGRIEGLEGVTREYGRIFAPVLPVTHRVVEAALDLDVPALGANDRIHAATCLIEGIRQIVSADAAFDRVKGIRRTDPIDAQAVRRLLADRT